MATTTSTPRVETPYTATPTMWTAASPMEGKGARAARYVAAGLRILFGFTFLWAFFDKLFGWGFATPAAKSWINGGSPTKGFLSSSATGPFASFYKSIAGAGWADWLFMIGLAGIGLALFLGVAMRIAAVAATVLYLMMWSVVLPPETNPVVDDHILGAVTVILLALVGAGHTFGLGRAWERIGIVARNGWLK